MAKPLVSICCITYNQKDYIRECLEGFLMQETSFSFEVVINDDDSNDGTKEIIKEYQEKYPDIIKPVFHKDNQYSQGVRGMFARFLFPIAKGKYLALCEGDDYWTDPQKLQKQVDFLEKNSDYALCFHTAKVVYEDGLKPSYDYPDVDDQSWYSLDELFNINFVPTNSVMYRKQDYTKIVCDVMPGDWYMHLFHAQFGKIKFINENMSVYRKHKSGIWWDYDENRDEIWRKFGVSHVGFYNEILRLYDKNKKYKNIIQGCIDNLLDELINVDEKYDERLFEEASKEFPGLIKTFTIDQHDQLKQRDIELKDITTQLLKVGDERNELALELETIKHRLKKLEQSYLWKLYKKIRKIKKKLIS